MADHKSFTIATNVKVYFCDPRSPWQRRSNENTNGLLRQYSPRGTDLSHFSQANLNKIALRLINVHGRPWDSKLLPIDYERCCSDQLNPPRKADIPLATRVFRCAAFDPSLHFDDQFCCVAQRGHIPTTM